MDKEQGGEGKKTQGFSFLFDFLKNMVTSVFRNDENAGNADTANSDESEANHPLHIRDFLPKKREDANNSSIRELLSALDALFSVETKRLFVELIVQTEEANIDEQSRITLSSELEKLTAEYTEDKRRIQATVQALNPEETEGILNDTIRNRSVLVPLSLVIAIAAENRFKSLSEITGNDYSTHISVCNGLSAKLRWLIASEKRIVDYIIAGLERFGNPKDRLKCLHSIEPYVASKISDPRLKDATDGFMTHLQSFYRIHIEKGPQPASDHEKPVDEELPEFGNEEAELLARFGRSDGANESQEDGESEETYEPGNGLDNSPEVTGGATSVPAASVKTEKAAIVRNDNIRKLEAEIERIASLDERIVTISFWIKNRYYDSDPLCSDFLAMKLESLEQTRARNGGLLADLFYNLRQTKDKKAQLELLETKLNAPEYIHLKQTLLTIIGNIRADINFESPSITEDSIEAMVDDQGDLSGKLSTLYAMRYDQSLSSFSEFIEERIEELETLSSGEIWERLEDEYYEKEMAHDGIDFGQPEGAFVTHNNIITLVRAIKKIPDKVERKKYIKEQEARKPLSADDAFYKQRRLLFYLMSAEIMDKPESMLKALADRVLLSFKEKKEYLEILKKSRFNAGGKPLTLEDELGIKDEHIAYFAAYIIGSELPFIEKRIKYIERFREGSLPLPQVAYRNASGEEAQAAYRDFFSITFPVIDAVLGYFLKFVEGKKTQARTRVSEETKGSRISERETPESKNVKPDDTNEPGSLVEGSILSDEYISRIDYSSPEALSDAESESAIDTGDIGAFDSEPDNDLLARIGIERDDVSEVGTDETVLIEDENPVTDPDRDADSLAPYESAETVLGSTKASVSSPCNIESDENEIGEDDEESAGQRDDIVSDVRYIENMARINAAVHSDIKNKGIAASGTESESIKIETRKKVEEKIPTTEQKIESLLKRLSLCFPEAVPELISGSIVPIFITTEEYIMRDVFAAFNQNIFIPVLYEGAQGDIHTVVASLQSFLNLTALSAECEKTILTIVIKMKKVRSSYIRSQVETTTTRPAVSRPDEHIESICNVLLGLDINANIITYLEEKYISACADKPGESSLAIKLTNMKNVLVSTKNINWTKVNNYFGKPVADMIAKLKNRIASGESLIFSLDDSNEDLSSEEREPNRAFIHQEEIKMNEEPEHVAHESQQNEPPLQKSAENDKTAIDEKKNKKENPQTAKVPTLSVKSKDTKLSPTGKEPVPKKAVLKSGFPAGTGKVKKIKPLVSREQQKKRAAQPTTSLGKKQSLFLSNAKELITDKLLFLIKEYSTIAMLDMLYKSYLGPASKKQTMLSLIDQKRHKAIYDAIATDEHTIEMLGFDRGKVMGAFEKKKRKLLS